MENSIFPRYTVSHYLSGILSQEWKPKQVQTVKTVLKCHSMIFDDISIDLCPKKYQTIKCDIF